MDLVDATVHLARPKKWHSRRRRQVGFESIDMASFWQQAQGSATCRSLLPVGAGHLESDPRTFPFDRGDFRVPAHHETRYRGLCLVMGSSVSAAPAGLRLSMEESSPEEPLDLKLRASYCTFWDRAQCQRTNLRCERLKFVLRCKNWGLGDCCDGPSEWWSTSLSATD